MFVFQHAELLNVLHFMYNGEVNVAQVKVLRFIFINLKISIPINPTCSQL